MSSLYARIAIVRSNMHVAVDVNHVIDIQIRRVFRHTRSHIDIKRRTQ